MRLICCCIWIAEFWLEVPQINMEQINSNYSCFLFFFVQVYCKRHTATFSEQNLCDDIWYDDSDIYLLHIYLTLHWFLRRPLPWNNSGAAFVIDSRVCESLLYHHFSSRWWTHLHFRLHGHWILLIWLILLLSLDNFWFQFSDPRSLTLTSLDQSFD